MNMHHFGVEGVNWIIILCFCGHCQSNEEENVHHHHHFGTTNGAFGDYQALLQ